MVVIGRYNLNGRVADCDFADTGSIPVTYPSFSYIFLNDMKIKILIIKNYVN